MSVDYCSSFAVPVLTHVFFISFMYILHEERQCSPSNIATLGLDVLAPLCTQNVGACRWTSGRAFLSSFWEGIEGGRPEDVGICSPRTVGMEAVVVVRRCCLSWKRPVDQDGRRRSTLHQWWNPTLSQCDRYVFRVEQYTIRNILEHSKCLFELTIGKSRIVYWRSVSSYNARAGGSLRSFQE